MALGVSESVTDGPVLSPSSLFVILLFGAISDSFSDSFDDNWSSSTSASASF